MRLKTKTALWPLCFALLCSACASKPLPTVVIPAPTIPPSSFDCASWPKPPAEADTSQAQVAAWVETRVYTAWQDCRAKLTAARRIVTGK